MKMGSGGEIPDLEFPEPEFDEFGNEIVKPIIVAEYLKDGVLIQDLANFDEFAAYTKELSRNRDQARMDRGEIDANGLRKQNGFLNGFNFSKAKIR